jgi:hypothetical protein
MSDWKSFITKPNKKKFQEMSKEEMIRRDERFKQNWQNWHDEHSEE